MIGVGECTFPSGNGTSAQVGEAAKVLHELGLTPLVLGPKEGLSLINGTHLTTALAIKLWHQACRLLRMANLTTAISMEATGALARFWRIRFCAPTIANRTRGFRYPLLARSVRITS